MSCFLCQEPGLILSPNPCADCARIMADGKIIAVRMADSTDGQSRRLQGRMLLDGLPDMLATLQNVPIGILLLTILSHWIVVPDSSWPSKPTAIPNGGPNGTALTVLRNRLGDNPPHAK